MPKGAKPTIKQAKAIKHLVETGSTVAEAMRQAGYSENTLRDPGKLTRTKAFIDVLNKAGLDDDTLAKAHAELIMASRMERLVFPHQIKKQQVTRTIKKKKQRVEKLVYEPLSDEDIKLAVEATRGYHLIKIIDDYAANNRIALCRMPEHLVRRAGVDMAYKVKSHYAAEKLDVGLNHQLTDEERDELNSILQKNKKNKKT